MGNTLKRIAACASSISLIVCTIPATSFADAAAVGTTFESGGITYTVTSPTEASVGAQSGAGTSFASSDANVKIPSTVNGYTITGINDYAFSDGADNGAPLSTVTMPSTIVTIGKYAFEGCTSLTSVSIPSSVEEIGMFAFASCPALKNLAFENPDNDATPLVMGEGAFYASSKTGGSIEELHLPKRLRYLPLKAFQNQTSLTKVTYAPKTTLSRIDSMAFNGCEALKSLEIPELTGKTQTLPGAVIGSNTSYAIGSDAFTHCGSLEELVFLGDEDYSLSENNFVTYTRPSMGLVDSYTTYSQIKTIVYYGDHTSSLYEGAKKGAPAANHYQKVDYYPSEPDVAAGTSPTSSIFVRNDVPLKDAAKSIGTADSKGDLVYEGKTPSLPEGKSWHYIDKEFGACAAGRTSAYPVDTNDLSYGFIVFDKPTLPYTGKPVNLAYTVRDANGTNLSRDAEYILTMRDENGEEVAASALKEKGSYTVTASAAPGSTYTGSTSATFAIEQVAGQITRLSGNAAYGTKNHALDVAFTADDVETVVLVGESAAAAGAAAAGLAGVCNAPIVATSDKSLSLEARRNLNVYKPSSVLLVGIKDSDAVTQSVKNVLGSTTSVSNAFEAKTAALSSYAMYNRTKNSGYWDESDTAFVASSSDVPAAALAGNWAYRMGCPVFLTDANGKLPSESTKAIAEGGFSSVRLIGLASDKLDASESQIAKAGFGGALETTSADNIYELSALCATSQLDAKIASPTSFMAVSAQDASSLMTAAAVSGQSKALLLIADETKAGTAAIEQLIEPNRYEISSGYVFGTRRYLSGEFQDGLQKLWEAEDTSDLAWGEVSLSDTAFAYDGKSHAPAVVVKDKNGKTLENGKDYFLALIDNATDATLFSDELVGAGNYTAVVTGVNDYAGSKNASFKIAKATQKLTVKTSKKSFKKSVLKRKAQGFTITTKAVGKVTYKVITGGKCLKVTSKGKATLKKNAPKGIYKVQVSAAATANYLASKPATIKVVVK